MIEINKLLVVGNGFDLAHGLPTRYNDFTCFIKMLRKIRDLADEYSIPGIRNELYAKRLKNNSENPFYKFKEVQKVLDIIYFENRGNPSTPFASLCNDLWSCTKNTWVHILDSYDLTAQSSDWIDFEKMISAVITKLESTNERACNIPVNRIIGGTKKGDLTIPNSPQRLYEELQQLTDMFEQYLKILEQTYFDNRLQRLECFTYGFDYVLNFNYTHLFSFLYNHNDAPVSFIHGEISHDPANIIMGTFDTTDNNGNLKYAFFKKYFQRILKQTGNNYRNWIDQHEGSIVSYFFGHSLDETDGDVISYIIEKSNKIFIHYHNEESHARYILNLIRIIGKEPLLSNIYNGKIVLTPNFDSVTQIPHFLRQSDE